MYQYDKLDWLIVSTIKECGDPLYARVVRDEADRIAEATGRKSFRIIDGRLQYLRKRMVIYYARIRKCWRLV